MLVRVFLPLFAALALTMTGCNQLARWGIGTTSINKVVSNPTQYKSVMVRGKVVNQVGILGKGAYEIRDDSGSIWILTQSGMPTMDSTVTVRGSAGEGVSFGGKNLAVTITEQERL
jgi:hypothetical protein